MLFALSLLLIVLLDIFSGSGSEEMRNTSDNKNTSVQQESFAVLASLVYTTNMNCPTDNPVKGIRMNTILII